MEIGLGAARDVPLASAREKAAKFREMVAASVDPWVERKEKKANTFGEVALQFIEGKEGGWRNEKHRDQWRFTLSLRKDNEGKWLDEGYCVSIRDKAIADLRTEDVLSILQPIWLAKNETASRVRGRIEAVWDAAKARRKVTGENPAIWRGHLANLLPPRTKLQRGHHDAMAFTDVPAFYRKIIARPSPSMQALAFTILTAARSGEVMGAMWSEIEEEGRLWRLPPHRMKGNRAPLSI